MAKKARNPNHMKNLKPFKKGEDPRRNMDGPPRKLPNLNELLAKVLGEEKDGVTATEAILAALRAKAARGDIRAAELLLDRGFGKVTQVIQNEGQAQNVVNLLPSNLSYEQLLELAKQHDDNSGSNKAGSENKG